MIDEKFSAAPPAQPRAMLTQPLELADIGVPTPATRASSSDMSENLAAALLQAHARGRPARLECQDRRAHRKQYMAALTLQTAVRKTKAALAPADLRIARAYADSLRPRDNASNLYTTCSRVEWAVYDDLGVNIGLYMRFLWWGLQIYGARWPTTNHVSGVNPAFPKPNPHSQPQP